MTGERSVHNPHTHTHTSHYTDSADAKYTLTAFISKELCFLFCCSADADAENVESSMKPAQVSDL